MGHKRALCNARLSRSRVETADCVTYVQVLTWFLDTPTPEAPFSVHRMALTGKESGTDVGAPSGTLVSQFPDSGLRVAFATDSTLYQSQVFMETARPTIARCGGSTCAHGATVPC